MGQNPKCTGLIKERTKETSSNIYSTFFLSTTIAGAGQHSFNICLQCTSYRGCRPTHQIPVQCWAIAGSMPVNRIRRWPNTKLSPGLLYTLRKHVALNQCCFNIDPQSSTLDVIETSLGDCTVFSDCCILLVTLEYPGARNTR